MVTHDAAAATLADRILFLATGDRAGARPLDASRVLDALAGGERR